MHEFHALQTVNVMTIFKACARSPFLCRYLFLPPSNWGHMDREDVDFYIILCIWGFSKAMSDWLHCSLTQKLLLGQWTCRSLIFMNAMPQKAFLLPEIMPNNRYDLFCFKGSVQNMYIFFLQLNVESTFAGWFFMLFTLSLSSFGIWKVGIKIAQKSCLVLIQCAGKLH